MISLEFSLQVVNNFLIKKKKTIYKNPTMNFYQKSRFRLPPYQNHPQIITILYLMKPDNRLRRIKKTRSRIIARLGFRDFSITPEARSLQTIRLSHGDE